MYIYTHTHTHTHTHAHPVRTGTAPTERAHLDRKRDRERACASSSRKPMASTMSQACTDARAWTDSSRFISVCMMCACVCASTSTSISMCGCAYIRPLTLTCPPLTTSFSCCIRAPRARLACSSPGYKMGACICIPISISISTYLSTMRAHAQMGAPRRSAPVTLGAPSPNHGID
jgi:hypothetical protein